MSTYELGLWVRDGKGRPLSVVVKTLAEDGYIVRQADAGKRAGLWCITQRGTDSLSNREEQWTAGDAWLAANPLYSLDEMNVLALLLVHGAQTPNQLAERLRLPLSPVRTAVKRLRLRLMIERPRNIFTGYCLTPAGQAVANAQQLELAEPEAA
jgi:hypothetical protein